MRKLIILVIGVLLGFNFSNLKAQDLHYSHHVYNPLYYNPAFTGFIENKLRLTAIYADRYRQAFGKDGMKTIYGSGDINIPIESANSTSHIGIGLSFYNHKAGENRINDNQTALLLSYRLPLGKDQQHTLSAGFNLSFLNRKFNYSNLQFGNQFDGISYNPNINSGELNEYPSINKLDLGMGLLYSFSANDKLRGYIGSSVFHLIPEKDDYINFGQVLRYNVHLGLEYDINNITLEPSFLIDNQGKAMELYTGVLFKYFLIKEESGNFSIFAGPYLRMFKFPIGDFSLYTLNALLGTQFNDFQLIIAFDNTINESKNTFGGFNGFEVSFNYFVGNHHKKGKKIYCPSFK
ncbi:MAG: PorP/SprF family type IX secretion system membrane protein [Chitinophagales bacterium]|nr:PorP/SprF family type IX secretion system membrane protein [Chitinophagales bacterium]